MWHATYDNFGAAHVDVAEVAQPWRLLGQYADDADAFDTGLHHSLCRYYHPGTGHHLSRDPLWPEPDTTPYAYAGHRPWEAADPTGAMPFPLVALGVAAVGGAIVGGVGAALTGRSILAGAAGGAVGGAVAAGAAMAIAAAGVTGLAALGLNALGAAASGVLGALAEQGTAGEPLCYSCAFAAGGIAGLLGLVTRGVARIPAVQRWAGRLGTWLGESRVGQWARAQAGEIAAGTRAAVGWVRGRAAASANAAAEALGSGAPRPALAGAGGGTVAGGGRAGAGTVLRSEAADVGGGAGSTGGNAGRASRVKFDNQFPEDVPEPLAASRLELRDGKWVEVRGRSVRSASGQYNFVSRDGTIYARRIQGRSGAPDIKHVDLARGEAVDYAGTVQFSGRTNRGHVRWWSNESGHYAPDPSRAPQAGLPMDRFRAGVFDRPPQPGRPVASPPSR